MADATTPRGSLKDVTRRAVADFSELTGQVPMGVSGVRPDDDGWSLLVDVLELERIPPTTSVLATYRVDTDAEGNLRSYERLRRYLQSETG
jgi:hypothetical protein